jgi:hypothetical protein
MPPSDRERLEGFSQICGRDLLPAPPRQQREPSGAFNLSINPPMSSLLKPLRRLPILARPSLNSKNSYIELGVMNCSSP